MSTTARLCRLGPSHPFRLFQCELTTPRSAHKNKVGGVILGARNSKHLPHVVRAARLVLTRSELDEIDRFLRSRANPPRPPFFGLERDRDGPHGRIMRYELNLVGTSAHLAELRRRVEHHEVNGATQWPLPRDREAFARQLYDEALAFPDSALTAPEVDILACLRERLAEASTALAS